MFPDWFFAPDYALARLVVSHLVAVIYTLAFASALRQFRGLLGERGLTPIPRFLASRTFRQAPSIFHFHYCDRFFAGVCWSGLTISVALVVGAGDVLPLPATMAAWLVLWLIYVSIVNVGQIWYGFGWESLLCEVGFLAVFLAPSSLTPAAPVLWLLWWLLFRLEFGAGLIKMRGDRCWKNLTCLYYHHETQPMPGPLSWYFHHLPRPMHRVEAAANHVTQLLVPFLLFAPQPAKNVAAAIIAGTQLWLMVSGNFAWLNALTIVLAFGAMDDGLLRHALPIPLPSALPPLWYDIAVALLFVAMAALSYFPVRNMIGPRQVMNRSFNRLHLVNTYGAFGSVTRLRHEIVWEGTRDHRLTPETVWHPYEFRGKPGDPGRRPRQYAPYHLRLDWLMWFVALSPRYGTSWLPNFVDKLLKNDPTLDRLLRRNPFPDDPPVFVRARMFRYRFTTPAERRDTGLWWHRELVGDFRQPVRLRRPARTR
ncbi:lipase maturation factor family protein [Fodinicola feengrottensis]|uniref:Lipase maturation factor family protein n=1 Tax=Fodinicola feengrottensis TaxID=435914 RepID=A0ABN2HYN1_9ACTN|nr:lipase maturation factor family protein [Fodinicola feengrottensis]